MLSASQRALQVSAHPAPHPTSSTSGGLEPVEEVYMVPEVKSGPLKKEILGWLVLSVKEMGVGFE